MPIATKQKAITLLLCATSPHVPRWHRITPVSLAFLVFRNSVIRNSVNHLLSAAVQLLHAYKNETKRALYVTCRRLLSAAWYAASAGVCHASCSAVSYFCCTRTTNCQNMPAAGQSSIKQRINTTVALTVACWLLYIHIYIQDTYTYIYLYYECRTSNKYTHI